MADVITRVGIVTATVRVATVVEIEIAAASIAVTAVSAARLVTVVVATVIATRVAVANAIVARAAAVTAIAGRTAASAADADIGMVSAVATERLAREPPGAANGVAIGHAAVSAAMIRTPRAVATRVRDAASAVIPTAVIGTGIAQAVAIVRRLLPMKATSVVVTRAACRMTLAIA
jgi:hypothetical protein